MYEHFLIKLPIPLAKKKKELQETASYGSDAVAAHVNFVLDMVAMLLQPILINLLWIIAMLLQPMLNLFRVQPYFFWGTALDGSTALLQQPTLNLQRFARSRCFSCVRVFGSTFYVAGVVS